MLILGITLLVISGFEWVTTGILMGRAPKDGIDSGFLLTLMALLGVIVFGILMLATGLPTVGAKEAFIVALCMAVSGIVNSRQLVDMSKAMQIGPNGIIWSILQCGFIIPFIVGVVFFHNPLNIARILGAISLIVALNMMGLLGDLGKGAIKSKGNWQLLTLRAFFWTGLTQLLINIPSHFNDIGDIGVAWRLFWCKLGFAIASPLFTICSGKGRELLTLYRRQARIPRVWLYALPLEALGIIVCFFAQFPGMDIMAKFNAGAISMPLMVGSCIIGFDLYALIFLHEKRTPLQFAALLLCLAGTVAICL